MNKTKTSKVGVFSWWSNKGEYKGNREFHMSGDLLVIYRIKDDALQLIRTGTHSELFR